MEKGIRHVNDYFGYFLPRKGICSGEELRLVATSMKKFYKSMTLWKQRSTNTCVIHSVMVWRNGYRNVSILID